MKASILNGMSARLCALFATSTLTFGATMTVDRGAHAGVNESVIEARFSPQQGQYWAGTGSLRGLRNYMNSRVEFCVPGYSCSDANERCADGSVKVGELLTDVSEAAPVGFVEGAPEPYQEESGAQTPFSNLYMEWRGRIRTVPARTFTTTLEACRLQMVNGMIGSVPHAFEAHDPPSFHGPYFSHLLNHPDFHANSEYGAAAWRFLHGANGATDAWPELTSCMLRYANAHVNLHDGDHDGVCNLEGQGDDNCPDKANHDQRDSDNDGIGDACDNCPNNKNADQADANHDGKGDICDDRDGDGVKDAVDNCPDLKNPDQQPCERVRCESACEASFDNCMSIPTALLPAQFRNAAELGKAFICTLVRESCLNGCGSPALDERQESCASHPEWCPAPAPSCFRNWSPRPRDPSWPACAPPPAGGCEVVVLGVAQDLSGATDLRRYRGCPGYRTLWVDDNQWSPALNDQFIGCAVQDAKRGALCKGPIFIPTPMSTMTALPQGSTTLTEMCQLQSCGFTVVPGSGAAIVK